MVKIEATYEFCGDTYFVSTECVDEIEQIRAKLLAIYAKEDKPEAKS
jgi:hypothetical protein